MVKTTLILIRSATVGKVHCNFFGGFGLIMLFHMYNTYFIGLSILSMLNLILTIKLRTMIQRYNILIRSGRPLNFLPTSGDRGWLSEGLRL